MANPFSLDSSQNAPTCIHRSLNRNSSCVHTSAEQTNRNHSSHLAIHENFQTAQAFWLPCIHPKSDTYESSTFTTLLGQVCWRSRRNCNNLATFSKTKTALYTASNSSRQLSTSSPHRSEQLSTALYYFQVHPPPSPIYLPDGPVWILRLPSITSPRPPVLALPSFLPPPLINRAPSLSIIGAASSLSSIIAHKERKPPHATSVAVNGKISAVENDG